MMKMNGQRNEKNVHVPPNNEQNYNTFFHTKKGFRSGNLNKIWVPSKHWLYGVVWTRKIWFRWGQRECWVFQSVSRNICDVVSLNTLQKKIRLIDVPGNETVFCRRRSIFFATPRTYALRSFFDECSSTRIDDSFGFSYCLN